MEESPKYLPFQSQDAGINGDAQRIEQMTWMFFLKVYDTQEETWEWKDEKYKSIIPEVRKPPVPLVKSPKVSPNFGSSIITIKSVNARGV